MAHARSWRLLCSHGAALFYVVRHPGCTTDDIARALVITPKTAWRLVRELTRSGLVQVRKEGRRHRYWPDSEGRLTDPVLSNLTLAQMISALSP